MDEFVAWLRDVAAFNIPYSPRKACMSAADTVERLAQALREIADGNSGDAAKIARRALGELP